MEDESGGGGREGVLKTERDISAAEVPLVVRGVPALQRAPQSSVPVLRRKVIITLAVKTSRYCGRVR